MHLVHTSQLPLSALTHQAVEYKPSKVHYENFNRLKIEVSNMRALPYFDVNAETTFLMDASRKTWCMHNPERASNLLCFQSLDQTEQKYQNLEREALRTIWRMEKFHYFLYGKEFTLETDQMSLVSIYKKHMIDISPRVQRLIVRSFPYLPFKVVYKKEWTYQLQMPLAESNHGSRGQHKTPDHNLDSHEYRLSG